MSASEMIVVFGSLITLAGAGALVALGVFLVGVVLQVRSSEPSPVVVRRDRER